MKVHARVGAIVVCMLAACGAKAGEEFEGTYRVQSHVGGDCTAQTDPLPGDLDGNDFFNFELTSFFGVPMLAYATCATAASCEESNLFNSFFRENGEWRLSVSFSTGEEPNCDITASRGTIELDDVSNVVIEITTKSGVIMNDDCFDALDLVDDHFDEFSCDGIERLIGAPL